MEEWEDQEEVEHFEQINTLFEIQLEVGLWSRSNFGDQKSKAVPGMRLGSLAPLLGIVEELGELEEASDINDIVDALGDIVIYTCDFACREGLELHIGSPMCNSTVISRNDALVALGKMCHVVLKRHQGIRGYDDDIKYKVELIKAVNKLLSYLSHYCDVRFNDVSLIKITEMTWNNVVKKRNWKKNKKTGGK